MRQLKVFLVFTLMLCIVFSQEYKIESGTDSQATRYAPEEGFKDETIPYVITEARLKEIRSQFMYWYFDLGGSNKVGDYQPAINAASPQIQKNLDFQLPFFGFRYNYTRISVNGYLEFSDPPENYHTYPLVYPVKEWPKQNDPSFIGIFLSKCRLGVVREEDADVRTAGVYFRLENNLPARVDKFGVELRERVKWDIREGIIGAETFEPKHVIIATWKNVSFAGGIYRSLTTTNTFQMVLATDEVFTYAIFNYLDLQWTTHTEAFGDTMSGDGGIPAFVGFNAGNGTRSFEYRPYSQTSIIRDLTRTGWGNGFKGRHIFRIDENIVVGSCSNNIDGANLPLSFAPESGNMLGGSIVNITGPCFKPDDKIICKFDIEEVNGTVIDTNRAICVQPRLSIEGYVRFQIAIGSGRYKWKGKYFVESPATATQRIFFQDNAINEKSPAEIKIYWNKSNLTINERAKLRISLWGYRETANRSEFLYIDDIANGVINYDAYTIYPSFYWHVKYVNVTDVTFGFLQISLEDPIPIEGTETKITPVIWSRPIPLSWYFAPQWELKYGKQWPSELCLDWIQSDRTLRNFTDELPKCPCSLEQALANKGQYLPDPGCDIDANPECFYHRGAVHCVRTGFATFGGSEQQCCYDRYHFLMMSHDQQWGSSPSRSHSFGSQYFNQANQVPTLSNWYHDMAPKFFCCLWQDEKSLGCTILRTERRPTPECVDYQAPEVAAVFGDPHIITFDDVQYTFNGKGEFVLVKTYTKNYLDVQGRFEQMTDDVNREVRATQLTSVVARGNTSTTVEVRVRPPNAQWRYRFDVFVDGTRIYFDKPSLKFQHFSGVIVYTPTYILNQSEVVIMFDSGAGVEIIDNHGLMAARVLLPSSFINKTRGLFGNFSFNMSDDFMTPDGEQIEITNHHLKTKLIHEEFGTKWMVDDNEDLHKGRSLFLRDFGRTAAYYNNITLIPMFRILPEDMQPPSRSVEKYREYFYYCEENKQCLYDLLMTGNIYLGLSTKMYKDSITNLKETFRRRIISCGVLETPRFGRKSNFYFIPGTKVTFECNEGYQLVGDKRRECLAEGKWNTLELGVTECLPM